MSAAAASALLSDISSLDLQSYIDSSQQHGQLNLYSDCLSQYLTTSTPTSSMFADSNYVHQSDALGFVYNGAVGGYGSEPSQQELQRFAFDPSPLPSTPLSSLCSPQYITDHYQQQTIYADAQFETPTSQHQQQQQQQQHTTLPILQMPTPSPYTPSPSPVSPAVSSTLPHLTHGSFNGGAASASASAASSVSTNYYSPSFPTDLQQHSSNFMIDCANTVLYNMESAMSSGWDTAAADFVDAASVAEALESPDDLALESVAVGARCGAKKSSPVEMKKPRVSRSVLGVRKAGVLAASLEEPEAKRRRSGTTWRRQKNGRDELDDILDLRGNCKFSSVMRPTTVTSTTPCGHSTPAPMLDPKRTAPGLYWNLVKDNQIAAPVVETPSTPWTLKSRVNVGKEFQCTALPRCKKDGSVYKVLSLNCCYNY